MSADYKLVPYGISDFEQVRKENKYLVDKTMFFEKMERAGNFLFLVRPRRFGKSLFLDMLESYYDINQKDNFQELFKGLYVADHPTKEQGQFQVLHLDFSLVGSDLENLYENFNSYCCDVMNTFIDNYKKYYSPRVVERVHNAKTAASKLNIVRMEAKLAGNKLYLIVDEYDNFTNNVLNVKGQKAYHDLTHGTGFYRDIFKLFKPMFHRPYEWLQHRAEHEPRRSLQPDAGLLGGGGQTDDPLL